MLRDVTLILYEWTACPDRYRIHLGLKAGLPSDRLVFVDLGSARRRLSRPHKVAELPAQS